MSDNKWQVTMSGTITMWDNKWQQVAQWVSSVTTRENKWQ